MVLKCHNYRVLVYTIRSEYPESFQRLAAGEEFVSVLNSLDWESDPNLAVSLQDSVLRSTVFGICNDENVSLPIVSCTNS